MASSSLVSSPLSSSSSYSWRYDVYPSFHGADVRKAFLSQILKEFRSKRIDPFIDGVIKQTKSNSFDLIEEAIRGSRIAIVILSRNYASSSWCLNELVEIMKCREDAGQVVVPIFYKVDPCDVMYQTGEFGKIFKSICKGKTQQDSWRWSQALENLAKIAGYHSAHWDNEAAMIEIIVNDISDILKNSTSSSGCNHFIQNQVVNQNDIEIPHLAVTGKRLKVLLDLDDVDKLIQLEPPWFSPRSRITITTLDSQPSVEAPQISYNDIVKPAWEVTTFSGDQQPLRLSLYGEKSSTKKFTNDSLSSGDKVSSHHQISSLSHHEWTERMVKQLEKEMPKLIKELVIAKQDQKEKELELERVFKGLLHPIGIYCADTLQHSFASHLSINFHRKGICAFVNRNEIFNKVEGASVFVVIFSNGCFSSTSYMDNLVRVLQCQRKIGRLVVPVFYGISPLDVVVQNCDSVDRMREWSSALQELRELPGYQLREESGEFELVEEIVKDVYEKLFPAEQIGMNTRLLEIEQLLCKQHWGIRRIGIWGMPGIGKTTLARAFFDQIYGGYEVSCFINDFDKAFHEKGLHHMLEKHFGKYLEQLPLASSSLPGEELSNKITLVVLDDVHNPLVAESFLRGIHWFSLGSLIIITSRDKQVFRHCQINHVYEVQSLNQDEALQLFSQCSYGKDRSEQNFLELSKEVIDYANGNPLALSFYGGELKGNKFSEMEKTFLKLRQSTPNKIYDLFKSSYDTLNDTEKNIFLDIVCFFNGAKVEYVMQLLEGCGFFPHVGIDVLVEKCLVTISEKRVKMHRIIQDFGREIINRETVQLGRCSRLWESRTIRFLLGDDKLNKNEKTTSTWAMDIEDIQAIFLDASSLLFDVKPTAFEDMLNLRFLKIYFSDYHYPHTVRLQKGLESLPYELRLLHWEYYPLQSLPQDFDPCHLVELNMPYSQLQKLWGGTKNLKMLKMVKLCHSQQLAEIDDVCKALNIELIDLQGCTKLQSFPATGQLQHLRVVNLSGCTEIKSFTEVSSNVEELHLEKTGIRELPISIGNVTKLRRLYLTGCASLLELPSTIGNASRLEVLDLSNCSSLMELPFSIGNATNLEKLNLKYCSNLVELPSSIGYITNLKKLCVTGCSGLMELPSSIGNITNLEELNLEYCTSLLELPFSIGNLKKLYLTGCLVDLPSSIRNSTSLIFTDLVEDNNLPLVTFSNHSGSKCLEVRRTKKGNTFVLKGERKDEHYVFMNLRMVNGNEALLFYEEGRTASKVPREMVEKLGLPDEYITFVDELITILLANMIPNWKTDVAVDHLILQPFGNEAKTQRQKGTGSRYAPKKRRDSKKKRRSHNGDKEKALSDERESNLSSQKA